MLQMQHYTDKRTHGEGGFTLPEILVVIGISMSVITLILVGYRRLGTVGTMERASNRVAQDVRMAQAFALSADPTRYGGNPPCGFGVHSPDPATGAADSYIIYAKIPSTSSVPCSTISKQWVLADECFSDITTNPPTVGSCPQKHSIKTITVKQLKLSEGGRVRFTPLGAGETRDDIYFEPPDPKTIIIRSVSSGGLAYPHSTDSFEIQSIDNPTSKRVVRVEDSGRVTITGGIILSKPCVPLTCSSFTYFYECGQWDNGCGSTFSCGISGFCPTFYTDGKICCGMPGQGDPLCPDDSGSLTMKKAQCYPAPPVPPDSINVTPADNETTKMVVAWMDRSVNESAYIVTRMNSSCDPGSGIPFNSGVATTPGVKDVPNSWTDSGLSPETEYCYKVTAQNGSGSMDDISPIRRIARTRSLPPTWSGIRPRYYKFDTPPIYRKNWLQWDNHHNAAWASGIAIERADADENVAGDVCSKAFQSLKTVAPGSVAYFDCDASLYPPPANFPPPQNTIARPGCQDGAPASILGVPPDTAYCYRLKVNRSDGYDSAWSAAKQLSDPNGMTPDEPPDAPTALDAEPQSASQIDLTWTDDIDLGYRQETSFILYRCQTGAACDPEGGIAQTIAVTPGNNTGGPATVPSPAFQDTLLQGDTLYRYCVKGRNNDAVEFDAYNRASACSAIVASRTKPAAPTGLAGVSVSTKIDFTAPETDVKSDAKVTLTWTNVGTTLQHVIVHRYALDNCTGAASSQTIGTGTAGPQPVTYDYPVYPNTLYSFNVTTTNPGESLPSNCVTINKTQDVAPTSPTALVSTPVSATQINLAWTDNSGSFAWGAETSFRIRRCLGVSCNPAAASELPFVGPNVTTFQDTSGLVGETTYNYCVIARNTNAPSTPVNKQDSPCATVQATTFLAAPTLLTATSISVSQIKLDWQDNSNNEGGYRVERGPMDGTCANWTSVADTVANVETYTHSATPAETKYCYRVYAIVGGVRASLDSNTPTARQWLTAPTGFSVTSLSGQSVKLTWMDNSVMEQGYKIEGCTGSTCSPAQFIVAPQGSTQYTDSGKTPNTWYCYRIRATHLDVDSQYTSSVCVQTPGAGDYTESGGFVVFEAEQFKNNFDTMSYSWYGPRTALPGYSLTGYMEALRTGLQTDDNSYANWGASDSPKLEYNVTFTTVSPNTYYVWVRGQGPGNDDRTVHAGLNDDGSNSFCIKGFNSNWTWRGGQSGRGTNPGNCNGTANATVTGATGPARKFDLWMRESGFKADRIVLVNDPNYIPEAAPTITLTPNPASVSAGVSTDISWIITNGAKKTCTLTNDKGNADWTGIVTAMTGTRTVNNLTSETTFTLKCSNGPLGETGTQTVTVPFMLPFSFHLTDDGDRSVYQGYQITDKQIHAILDTGTAQNVSFSITSPDPAIIGMTSSVSPASCLPTSPTGCLATYTIGTSASTPLGTYPITITGRYGALTNSTTFNLTVNTPPAFNYKLDGTPPAGLTMSPGGTQANTVTVSLVSGTPLEVTLTNSALPANTTAVWSGGTPIDKCTPTPTSCTRTFTVTTALSTPPGVYPITITGTAGVLTRMVTFNLTVTAVTFPVKINFQPALAAIPAGYQVDNGAVYDAARGYGWSSSIIGSATDRGLNADQRLDTFVYSSAAATWNFTLPNGTYYVSLATGDAQAAAGPHRVVVEGITAINNITTANNDFEFVTDLSVTVSDGSLSVVIGGGGGSTMLNYIIIAQSPAPVPANALVVHLKLDEGSNATTFTDSSGSGNGGSCTNPYCPATGQTGRDAYAVDFDGVDDYLLIADSDSTDFGTGNFSVAAWFKHPTDGLDHILMADGETEGVRNPDFWEVRLIGSGAVRFETESNGGTTGVTTPVSYGNDVWHHVVAVRTGTTLKICIDGTICTSITGTVRNVSNIFPTAIGVAKHTTMGGYKRNPFTGLLDDIRIYNYDLDSAAISALFSSFPLPTSGLIAHWKFDEGSGGIAVDSKGGFNGTVSGPVYAVGNVKFGLNFDNTSDSVNVGNPAGLTNKTPFTYCAWIYPRSKGGLSDGRIIHKGSATARKQLQIDSGAGKGLTLLVDRASTQAVAMTLESEIRMSQWQHICGTYSDADGPRLYRNGVEMPYDPSTPRTTGSGLPKDDSVGNFYIGNRGSDYTKGWDGLIDEVRVYDKVLSAAEMQTLIPTAAYAMKESSGSTTADATGNGFTGNLVNGAVFAAGQFGNGIQFNATDNGVDTDDPRVVVGTSFDIPSLPFTVMAWINPTNYNDYRAIFSKRDSFTSGDYRFDVGLLQTTGIVYIFSSTCCQYFTYAPPVGAWTHLAVVAASAGTSLYVNGSLSQTISPIALGSDATANVAFGGTGEEVEPPTVDNDPFKGRLDEVRIYNIPLTQTEINAAKNTALP